MSFDQEQETFKELLKIYDENFIIPYIGAGFSIPASLQWGEFLDKYFKDIKKDEWFTVEQENEYLKISQSDKPNKDELLADLLVDVGAKLSFKKAIKQLIDVELPAKMKPKYDALHSAFPLLKITTNYDRLIEISSDNKKPPIVRCGNAPEDMDYLLTNYDKFNILLKIHGCASLERDIVLTKKQYQEMYGDEETFSYEKSKFAEFLKRVFSNNHLLFLGCSLYTDRPLQILNELYQMDKAQSHYAIMKMPEGRNEKAQIRQRLGHNNISVVWINDFDEITEILEILSARKNAPLLHKDRVQEILYSIKLEIDKENRVKSRTLIDANRNLIDTIPYDDLKLEFELLDCKTLVLEEELIQAIELLENIYTTYQDSIQVILLLAELYRRIGNLEKDAELIERARLIDSSNSLLLFNEINRKLAISEPVDLSNYLELVSTIEPDFISSYKIILSIVSLRQQKNEQAKALIEEAISFEPDRWNNYKIEFIIKLSDLDHCPKDQIVKVAQRLLSDLSSIEHICKDFGAFSSRNELWFSDIRIKLLRIAEDFDSISKYEQSIELIYDCFFDDEIDHHLQSYFSWMIMNEKPLITLISFIQDNNINISTTLSNLLLGSFCANHLLSGIGKEFYRYVENDKISILIDLLEQKDYQAFLKELRDRQDLIRILVLFWRDVPELRIDLIQLLSDDHPDKMEFEIEYLCSIREWKKAYELVKKCDYLSMSDHLKITLLPQIFGENKAWDHLATLNKHLLSIKRNSKVEFRIKSNLFTAKLYLKDFLSVINIGKELLQIDKECAYLNLSEREALLTNTIQAYMYRSRITPNLTEEALKLINEEDISSFSYQFNINVLAKVYAESKKYDEALNTVVKAILKEGEIKPQDYSYLHFFVFIELGKHTDVSTDSEEIISENTYVKIKSNDQWRFIGSDTFYIKDSFPISSVHPKYDSFIGKRVGELVTYTVNEFTPSTNEEIGCILTPKKFVLHKIISTFHKFASQNDLPDVQMMRILDDEENLNLEVLESLVKPNNTLNQFFEAYKRERYPLSFLATTERDFGRAIARIVNSDNAFINSSSGLKEEFDEQISIAKKVIEDKEEFVLDASSALFIIESGLLPKIIEHVPNIITPQSIIDLLTTFIDKYTQNEGQEAVMSYQNDRIVVNVLDPKNESIAQKRFIKAIKILESKKVEHISESSKSDTDIGKIILPVLTDACNIADIRKTAILTDDYLHLKIHQFETMREAPKYFSTQALFRYLFATGRISFDEFLDLFHLLGIYRHRFLMLTKDDIEKAVFGSGKIEVFRPENIRKLNLPLLLSEDYHMDTNQFYILLINFFAGALNNHSLTQDNYNKLLVEIVESFPTHFDKNEVGKKIVVNTYKLLYKQQRCTVHISETLSQLLELCDIFTQKIKVVS